MLRRLRTLSLAALAAASLIGCQKKAPVAAAAPPPKPAPPPKISEVDLKSYRPNEAGAIMIIMYHAIDARKPSSDRYLNRAPDDFRKDLETLHKRKYHPVTVLEMVENRMDVPAGKTPVIITFDDARETQFRIVPGSDGQPRIDPDCAVGIMETFHKQNPDWPMKATFFVLPGEGRNGDPFGQPDYVADKFEYLLKNGYEVANHSSTHANMRRLTADRLQWEIANAVRSIRQAAPQAQMQTLAIPYGALPRKELRPYLRAGESAGTRYENKAVLLAAWRPVMSPITKTTKKVSPTGQIAPFDPYSLERVKPDPNPKAGQTFEFWLKFFDENPSLRYVSDGNKLVAAAPESMKALIDPARVKAQGKTLQLYSLTGSGGRGGTLSVE